MRLLILGGTQFVGRHLTERALAEGHEVTLFNRNQAAPDLFPQVEVLTGDRLKDVNALEGRTWGAVIDTSAYTPATARRSAELLQDAVRHYTFISTVSVYQDFAQVEMGESSYASLALQRGTPIEIVSERLGHSSVGFTLDTYRHLYEAERREAAVSLIDLVGRTNQLRHRIAVYGAPDASL